MHRIAVTSLVLLLFSFAHGKASAQSNDEQQVERPTAAEQPQDFQWFDRWQQDFTESMDYTAQQLDDFFSIEGQTRPDGARAKGKLRLGWEPRSRDFNEFDVRFRVRIKLPALKDRVELMFSDDEDDDQDNTIKAARNINLSERDSATLALRFQRDDESKFSHRIGAGRRDQLYVKSRYRDQYVINPKTLIRYDAEVYYYTEDKLGAELGATLQYSHESSSVYRFNNRYYFRDKQDDWLWRHEFQYLRPLSDDSAVIYTFFTEGKDRPNYHVEEVYTSMRWRTNKIREWLFFEVEPFVVWLRKESFDPSYGLALRVEMHYGQNR